MNRQEKLQLYRQASIEATHFRLPEDWRHGRETRHVITIDPEGTEDIDDGLSLTCSPSGYILHVSIADPGSFLGDSDAMIDYAAAHGWTRYRSGPVKPLLPPHISEDVLSLRGGVERPALTVHLPVNFDGELGMPTLSREIVIAYTFSYEEANRVLATQRRSKLRYFEAVAERLQHARLAKAALGNVTPMAFDEGRAVPSRGKASLIVQEAMIAANRGVGHYVVAHRIPRCSRNFVIPHGPRFAHLSMAACAFLARAYYDTQSLGHDGVGADKYVHFTSPLRRWADFANHCNIVAHLEGREFPFSEEFLQASTRHINRMERRLHSNADKARPPRQQVGLQATHLLYKTQGGQVHEGELATALFGELYGSNYRISLLRREAAQYVARNIHIGKAVVDIAVAKKWATIHADASYPGQCILETSNGKQYSFEAKQSKLRTAVTIAHLIGRVAGEIVAPVIPERMTPEGKIMRRAHHYLQELSKDHGFSYLYDIEELPSGSYRATAIITSQRMTQRFHATLPSKTAARREAAARALSTLELSSPSPKKVAMAVKMNILLDAPKR